MKAIIPLLLALFLSADLSPAETGEKLSESGLYAIRMQTDPPRPVMGTNTILMTVVDRSTGRGVEGAVIEVTPWMTLHSHGSTKSTRVQEKGKGVYLITDVYLTMEGEWDLLLSIQKDGKKDTAVFPLKKVTR